MKKPGIIIVMLCISISLFAQKQTLTTQPELDVLICGKIDEFRQGRSLIPLRDSEVLTMASNHHSCYMATTQIVSHYQTMNLVSMSSIYSPRKRMDYFANSELPEQMSFSQIVVGIKSNNQDVEELANEFMYAILNSENILILLNNQANYVGLSTVSRKNRYYLTISFAIENEEVLTVLE